MTKVYVVTKGSYSDYRIVAVSLDKKVAKKIAQAVSGDEADVETFDAYEEGMSLAPVTYYCVETDDQGVEERRWQFDRHPWDTMWVSTITWSMARNVRSRGVSDRGFDEALKAARDSLTQYQAKKAGIT